jgi:hypothetical protein
MRLRMWLEEEKARSVSSEETDAKEKDEGD